MSLLFIVPHNAFQYRLPGPKLRNLGQVADVKVPAPGDASPVRFLQPGHNFQQGGLSRAVDANQPYLLALVHGKRRIVKQQALCVGFCQMLDGYKIHDGLPLSVISQLLPGVVRNRFLKFRLDFLLKLFRLQDIAGRKCQGLGPLYRLVQGVV